MLLTNSAKGGIVVNKYRCESNRHFTDKEHDGKKCPYDDMSASELSEEIAINIPQNEFQAYNRVREVGKQYGLSDKETHAIHRYVNSFNDGWYKMGVLGIEMEAAALYMNAARAGKRALAICTVSDHILRGEALDSDTRQVGFTDMMKIALEVAIKIQG